MLEALLQGSIAGFIATLAMTLTEIPSWKKWHLHGVFEWHENQVLASRLLRRDLAELNYWGIFGLHFLNGTLGGIALVVALNIIRLGNLIPFYLVGTLYGIFLWTLTLVPIHKPITGLDPFRHPLGIYPSIASFLGHLAYGLVVVSILQLW